jgi:uncharacterized protein (TIGR03086 family)
MTNTRTDPTPDGTGPASAPFDPRPVLARAVALGGAVITAVRPDQLDQPTPCSEFDVRQLLGHLVIVLDRVALLGQGRDPFTTREPHVADTGWAGAWHAEAHRVQEAWSDPEVLERTFEMPWGVFSGSALLGTYTNEVTVHTWDLAAATGQRPTWDDEVVGVAFDAMRRALPAVGRRQSYDEAAAHMPEGRQVFAPPFDEAVPVPPEAALIDQLVAWNGRNPTWP